MPVRINCPRCNATLNMPESMYGRAVKCPSCKSPFQCPTPPGAVPAAPAPPPPAARPASSGSPFDFEQPAPVATAVPARDDYDDRDYYAPRPRRTGWRRVQAGLFFFYISAGCLAVAALLLIMQMHRLFETPGTIQAMELIAGLALSAGAVLAVFGFAGLVHAPADSYVRGPATAGTFLAILFSLDALTLTVLTVMQMINDEPPPAKATLYATLTLIGSLIACFLLCLFALVSAAIHLRSRGLMGSTIAYAVVLFVGPILLLMLTLLKVPTAGPTMRGGQPEKDNLGLILALVLLAVDTFWFCALMMGLSGAIDRQQRRG
jgi:hypothetical protein